MSETFRWILSLPKRILVNTHPTANSRGAKVVHMCVCVILLQFKAYNPVTLLDPISI